ncbi:MAG TPA: hypothetical protein VEX15_05860 [Nocardioidaceae bacterium]|nr:hypothetical protein [Nocardioidaceae bacterium]
MTVRPAPDTMALLSGFVPAEQGVAAWKSLDEHARSLRGQGDPRSLGQIMADTLVERVTGQAAASAVPVEIGLTMPTDALLVTMRPRPRSTAMGRSRPSSPATCRASSLRGRSSAGSSPTR